MPGEVRRRAKAINFGIIYGISAFGLANQLGIAREEAGAYIKKYFERFPGIRDYMEETKAFCRKNGYVSTLFGRKCHYPDIVNSNPSIRAFNERAAINARLQGTRRRHHPPRHDAHGRGAGEEAALARRCCCRCTTNWCSKCRKTRSKRRCRWCKQGDGGGAAAGGVAVGAACRSRRAPRAIGTRRIEADCGAHGLRRCLVRSQRPVAAVVVGCLWRLTRPRAAPALDGAACAGRGRCHLSEFS